MIEHRYYVTRELMDARDCAANVQHDLVAHFRPDRQAQATDRKEVCIIQQHARRGKFRVGGLPMNRGIVVLAGVYVFRFQRYRQVIAAQARLRRDSPRADRAGAGIRSDSVAARSETSRRMVEAIWRLNDPTLDPGMISLLEVSGG